MSFPSPAANPANRLQNRFELLDEWPHVTAGRLFRARDLAFAELVGVKYLNLDHGLSPEARRQLGQAIWRLQSLSHPHLVRLYAFDSTTGILIQEWIQGSSLLDLLRRRRELPVADVVRILETLPGTLDFLARHGLAAPGSLLGKLFVQFDHPHTSENATALSVDQWPPFVLKLNALGLRELLNRSSSDDTTNIGGPRAGHPDASPCHDIPQEFARLFYELLGGRIRELDNRRYSPVGALGETGNAVLREILLGAGSPDCQTVWQDLLKSRPEFPRFLKAGPIVPLVAPPRALRIPAPLLQSAHPAKVLTLRPVDSANTRFA